MDDSKKEELWNRNFILIIIINFFVFTSFQMFPTAISPYLASLGADTSLTGMIVAVGNVATLLARPFAGAALDKFGRKIVLFVGITIMGVASLAHLIPIVAVLFVVRSVHGVGFSTSTTSTNTIATDNLPKHRFAEGMGFFSLSNSLALAIAPAIALSLGPRVMVLTATGLIIAGFFSSFFIKCKSAADIKAEKPEGGKQAYFEKSAILPAFILFSVTLTYGGVITFISQYAAQNGIENIGIYFAVYSIVLLLSRPAIGKFLDRRGFGAAVIPGIFATVLGLVVLAKADSLPLFVLSSILYGLGQGGVQTSAQTMAVAYAPKDKVGLANATYFIGFDAGVGFGAMIAGFVAARIGFGDMYLVSIIFPIAGIFVFLYAAKKNKNRPRP